MTQDKLIGFQAYQSTVKPAWIDYNGHLNEAHYVTIFSEASDLLAAHVGFGPDVREKLNMSFFTGEAHICYLDEASEGEKTWVATQMIEVKPRMFHTFDRLYVGDDQRLSATREVIQLAIDMESRRVSPFPEDVQARLKDLEAKDRHHPRPAQLGRQIVAR